MRRSRRRGGACDHYQLSLESAEKVKGRHHDQPAADPSGYPSAVSYPYPALPFPLGFRDPAIRTLTRHDDEYDGARTTAVCIKYS